MSSLIKNAHFVGIKANFTLWALSAFWLIDLLNPVFKKYDYGAEYPMILLFGVLIFFISLAEWNKKREKNWLEAGTLLVFGLAIILSFVFSQTKNVGFSEVLAYLSLIPLYLLLANQKLDWHGKFFKVVIWGLFLSIILGFILYFVWPENRMAGPFFNILYHANVWPNAFALFLLLSWPVVLNSEIKNKWKYLLIVFAISALFLTFSRGALIAFGGQIFLLLIYFLKRIRLKGLVTAGLIGVLAVGIFWGANQIRSVKYEVIEVRERISFSNNEGLTSKNERKDFWLGSLKLIGEKPWFGWGPFSFRYAYNPIQKTVLGNADHSHNIFLKIGVENGLIALWAFLLFLFLIAGKVIKRFKNLNQKDKDLLIILMVSVAGAFAHNLIDYNFNFFANFLLLFIFLIFIRSLVIENEEKVQKKPVFTLVFSLIIALVSLYEVGVLAMDKSVYDKSFLNLSLYPRNHYLEQAERGMSYDNFDGAIAMLDKQIKFNPLDSQAWHLKGVILCNEKYEKKDYENCVKFLTKAIELNPKNDFSYYADYFMALNKDYFKLDNTNLINRELLPKDGYSVTWHMKTALKLLEEYFVAVQNNIHFTALTTNVEAAAELVDILLENFIGDSKELAWTKEQQKELLSKKENMLETAEILRVEIKKVFGL